jgi:hypothetical protein
MLCELLIFTITISRYGYSTCMYTIFKFAKYCKILISCTNNDQIPYFCLTLYIRCMKVKLIVHTRIHCITSSQVKCFFICLCSPSVCWENKQIENISTWGKCSIHNADIYIVYSPFDDSENRGIFFSLKIGFN